jgi:hypothetical protein
MLPSTAPILHLKEVPGQVAVRQRKSGGRGFFQYFTQGPSHAWIGSDATPIPHETTEILKEEIYTHSANGLRPDFLQAHGVKPLKEVPGAPGIDNVTVTRPRDPGPGARAALTRQPCRPGLSLEEEVVMDRSPHIAAVPRMATATLHRCILALDLGTSTGWALRAPDGLITSGTASFRPGRYDGGGMRYLRFTNWLTEIDRLSGPIAAIWFEEVRRHAGTDAAHVYGGLMATLTAWAELRGVPYAGVPVGTIKRHATGKGNALKAAMIAAARVRGFSPADDNEADAIALLLWAIETNGGVA